MSERREGTIAKRGDIGGKPVAYRGGVAGDSRRGEHLLKPAEMPEARPCRSRSTWWYATCTPPHPTPAPACHPLRRLEEHDKARAGRTPPARRSKTLTVMATTFDVSKDLSPLHISPKSKRCKDCKLERGLGAFGTDKSRRDGLNGRCRDCDRARSRAYYARKPEARKVYYRENRDRILARVAARYRGSNPDYPQDEGDSCQ
jgi:hypothetical protein